MSDSPGLKLQVLISLRAPQPVGLAATRSIQQLSVGSSPRHFCEFERGGNHSLVHFACLKRENGFPKVAVGLVRNVARQGGRQVKALFLCHLLKDADDLGTRLWMLCQSGIYRAVATTRVIPNDVGSDS